MTTTRVVLTDYVAGQTIPALAAISGFSRTGGQTGKALVRPLQWREFIVQVRFLMQVSFLATAAVSMPPTVLITFTLNILLREFGTAKSSGGGAGLRAITQLGPLGTALVTVLHDDQLLQRHAHGPVAGGQR